MAVQSCLQGAVLEHYVAPRNANVEAPLAAEGTYFVDKFCPALEFSIQVKLYISFKELRVVVPHLPVVSRGDGSCDGAHSLRSHDPLLLHRLLRGRDLHSRLQGTARLVAFGLSSYSQLN